MSKPLVLFTAPVGTRSGYGAHSRDIARSLIAMDKFDIKIFPVRWGSTPQNALNEKDPNDIGFEKLLYLIKRTQTTRFSDLMKIKLNGTRKKHMEI